MAEILDCRLSAGQVAKLAGIKYATMDYWLRPGRGNLLQCDVPATGKGSERKFGFLDVIRIRAVARMRQENLSLQTIRKVAAKLAEHGIDDPLIQTARMVITGTEVFWAIDDDTLLEILTGQLAAKPLMVLPIGELTRDTVIKMRELCAA